jgi:uncharacterized protein with HEPN domain
VSPRKSHERLQDIIDAVERINRHTVAMSGASYRRDDGLADAYEDAVHYQLIVIGEAIRSLPDAVKNRDPEIPWSAILGLRNHLSHEYFRVDPEVIRRVVHKDLADLSRRVRGLMVM